MENNDFDIDNF